MTTPHIIDFNCVCDNCQRVCKKFIETKEKKHMGFIEPEKKKPQDIFSTTDVWLLNPQSNGRYCLTFYHTLVRDPSDYPELIRLGEQFELIVCFDKCEHHTVASFHKDYISARMFTGDCLVHLLGYREDLCNKRARALQCNETLKNGAVKKESPTSDA